MTERHTKKKKVSKSKSSAELWKKIDTNFIDKKPIECVYRSVGQRENCDLCESSVSFTEDGFLAC